MRDSTPICVGDATIMYDNEYLQMNNGYDENALFSYTVLDSPCINFS